MMKKKIKKLYKSNIFVKILLLPIVIFYRFIKYVTLPDKLYLKIEYKKRTKRKLNLSSPQRFTEKIQWLKLYDRKEIYTICADKLKVKDYVKNIIGEEYIIPTVFFTSNVYEITEDNFPNYPVIIKTTHDSSKGIVVKDVSRVDFRKLQKQLKRNLRHNHYRGTKEWEYKNIVPHVLIEKLINDDSGNDLLNDYKIHCFHGKPYYIQTIFDRQENVKEDWYDTDWNLLNVYYFSDKKKNVEKPELLTELLDVATRLSKKFNYVRVDLYIAKDKVYFGELTFRPLGGFMNFVPDSFDFELGKKLRLTMKD